MPPSKNELFKRLLNRDQNDKKIANERMKQFNKMFCIGKNYDFVVINDELENCYKKINNYINLKKKNLNFEAFDKKLIKNMLKN